MVERKYVFTRLSAEYDLSEVAFVAGSTNSSCTMLQTPENAVLSATDSSDKICKTSRTKKVPARASRVSLLLKALAEVVSVAQKVSKGDAKQKIKCVHLSVNSNDLCFHLTIKPQTQSLTSHTKQHIIVVQQTLEGRSTHCPPCRAEHTEAR